MADETQAVPEAQSPKSILESKTFWGLVIGLGVPIAAKHGIVLDPTGLATDVSTIVGGALAIYGRITASKGVKLV